MTQPWHPIASPSYKPALYPGPNLHTKRYCSTTSYGPLNFQKSFFYLCVNYWTICCYLHLWRCLSVRVRVRAVNGKRPELPGSKQADRGAGPSRWWQRWRRSAVFLRWRSYWRTSDVVVLHRHLYRAGRLAANSDSRNDPPLRAEWDTVYQPQSIKLVYTLWRSLNPSNSVLVTTCITLRSSR